MATQVKELFAAGRLGPEDREGWLALRRQGIGGSDIAALFGLHPFRTALDVYREKVGEAEPEPPTPAMLRGMYLEPVAAQLYAERTGRKIRRQPLRAHPEYPFLIGSVDRQILRGGDVGEPGVLEIKAPGLRVYWEIRRQGLRDYMILQLQHYLTVYGYSWGSFAIFSAENWELLHFDVEADPEVQQRIIEVAGNFWKNHVEPRIPPEPQAPTPKIDLPETGGELVSRTDEAWADAVRDLREAKEIKAEAEELEKRAKERLIELAGGFGVFEGAGARIYYRQMPGRKTFDKKALASAKPLNRVLVRQALFDRGISATEADLILDGCELDLELFEKAGSPYAEFRAYFLTGAEEE